MKGIAIPLVLVLLAPAFAGCLGETVDEEIVDGVCDEAAYWQTISPASPYPGLDCEEGPMRTIPVNFFVYKNNEGTDWLANVSTLDQGIDLMNSVYNHAGINFTRANIVYVDMNFPDVSDNQSSEPAGNKTNVSGADDGDNIPISQLGDGFVEGYEPTMSNIVLVSDGWGAYSWYPWGIRDHYVSFVRATTFATSHVPSHEVGHHLGLYHTHKYYDSLDLESDLHRATIWTNDWVVPDDLCYSTGDFICDTPYDCYRWCEEMIGCNASDLYEETKPGNEGSDAPQCTEEEHAPSLVNLMSRYGDRSEITEDQGARARYFIQFMMDNNRNGNQLVLYESD